MKPLKPCNRLKKNKNLNVGCVITCNTLCNLVTGECDVMGCCDHLQHACMVVFGECGGLLRGCFGISPLILLLVINFIII